MSWYYEQATGKIYLPGGAMLALGYSGNGPGKNNPAMQEVENVGPIPVGSWVMSAPRDTTHHGPYAMPLTPMQDTNTFGRSAFMCHGDSIPHPGEASEGCIVLPRFARQRLWESGVHVIEVISGLPVPDLGGEISV